MMMMAHERTGFDADDTYENQFDDDGNRQHQADDDGT